MKMCLALPRAIAALMIVLCCFAVASCQSGNADDVLHPGSAKPDPEPAKRSSPDADKIGSGSVRIAVLVPFSATGADAGKARDLRDGVTLAVDDLGKDALTVVFEDISGAKIKEKALEAMSKDAAAVVGPFDPAAAAELSTVTGSTLSPIFLLAQGVVGAPGIYSVPLQDGTSAAAGANAASKQGSAASC